MTIHGNTNVWAQLESDMPLAAVLEGPPGVGKWTGATEIASKLTSPENIVRYQDMSVQDARELGDWLQYPSAVPRIAIVEPADCHPNVWAVLKTLIEESSHCIWLVGSSSTPKAIKDLCFTYQFAFLSAVEVKSVLDEAGIISIDETYLISLGSVDKALVMHKAMNVKSAVANWVRAVEESNRDLLLTATHTWEKRHTELLTAELQQQLLNKTVIEGVRFRRVTQEKILAALSLLQGLDHPIAALGVGLNLMPRSR